MSWINDLDACASAGIISFDAPAYIKGVQPRYYGNPDFAQLPDFLPPAPQQPKKDEFSKSTDPHHNPTWKKVLFGTVVAGALAAGIYAISKGKINLKNIKLPDWVTNNKVIDFCKDIPNKIKNLHLLDKLKGLFKKPATP